MTTGLLRHKAQANPTQVPLLEGLVPDLFLVVTHNHHQHLLDVLLKLDNRLTKAYFVCHIYPNGRLLLTPSQNGITYNNEKEIRHDNGSKGKQVFNTFDVGSFIKEFGVFFMQELLPLIYTKDSTAVIDASLNFLVNYIGSNGIFKNVIDFISGNHHNINKDDNFKDNSNTGINLITDHHIDNSRILPSGGNASGQAASGQPL